MNDTFFTNLIGRSVLYTTNGGSTRAGIISAMWVSKVGPVEFLIVDSSDEKLHQKTVDQIEKVYEF